MGLDLDLVELAGQAIAVVDRHDVAHDVGHGPVGGVAQDHERPVGVEPRHGLQRHRADVGANEISSIGRHVIGWAVERELGTDERGSGRLVGQFHGPAGSVLAPAMAHRHPGPGQAQVGGVVVDGVEVLAGGRSRDRVLDDAVQVGQLEPSWGHQFVTRSTFMTTSFSRVGSPARPAPGR